MATATFSGSYGHNMTLELRAERSGEPNIAGNSSNVHVTGYLHTNGYASMWGVTSDVTITINGGGAIEHPAINIGTNSTQKIFDHTYTIGHNNDGTKTVGIKLSVGLNTGGYGSAMVAFDFRLPDIPRASSVSDMTGTLGSAMTININRKVSSFTHTVKYNFGALNGTIATGVGASVSWTPPLNLATAMPNKTSDWGNITVDTYNGSTKIGSATCRLTLNVPDSIKPTFTDVTLAEGNSVVGNVFTQENTFVEVLSQPTVTFNGADGAYNSTVTGYKAEIVGKNMTVTDNGGSFGLLKFNGTATVRASVQDSRGRWSDSKEVEIEVIEYSAPLIGFTLVRSGADKTTLTVIRTVRISPLMVGGVQKNKMTLNFKTRPLTGTEYTANNGSASGVWTTQSELVNSNANLSGTFSGAQSWEVVGTVSDLFTSASHSDSIGTEVVHTAKAPTAFGFGKIPEHTNAVDSDWQYYFNNKPIQHHQLTANNGTAIKLADGSDLNNATEPGFYNGNNLLHAPTGSGAHSWRYIRVTKHTNNNGFVLQEAIDFYGAISAFRVQAGGQWNDWKYYAIQNSVAEFTAVNQTKVYSATLAGPYGLALQARRVGNLVSVTLYSTITSTDSRSGTASETIPVGWRPCKTEVIVSAGFAGGGTGTQMWTGESFCRLFYKTNGQIDFTIRATAKPLGVYASTTWITTDPFPSE
ncbi:hypothetical protein GPZ88_01045 [Streptococcus ruminicola]|uniref:Uncharacterized protein n=1 Tax=Streptococcus ruminicola TaxID=2686210 RepID=A0A6G8HY09_9STRE|nr:DUF859 family phage minor structural protein [Streptococcus ruminicola]QIM45726.1 hypothetical protein GPZ88_01045 [Streptococcus ruminicola]